MRRTKLIFLAFLLIAKLILTGAYLLLSMAWIASLIGIRRRISVWKFRRSLRKYSPRLCDELTPLYEEKLKAITGLPMGTILGLFRGVRSAHRRGGSSPPGYFPD